MEYMESKRPLKIGLTGGIGSGKSTFAKAFEKLGVPVFYSDTAAKQLYFNPEIRNEILSILGVEAYLNPKTLNTTFIRQTLYRQPGLKSQLEQILHPAVRKEFELFAEKYAHKPYLINESALIMENNLCDQFDYTILVYTNPDLRRERVLKRDAMSAESLELIIQSQMLDNQRYMYADFILINEDIKEIEEKVFNIHTILEGKSTLK